MDNAIRASWLSLDNNDLILSSWRPRKVANTNPRLRVLSGQNPIQLLLNSLHFSCHGFILGCLHSTVHVLLLWKGTQILCETFPNAAPAELPWVQPGVIAARFAGWKMWGRLAGGSQPNSTKNHDRDFTTLRSFRVNLRRQEEGNWWLGQGLLYWSAL